MKVLIVDHDTAALQAAVRGLGGFFEALVAVSKNDCLARIREGGIAIVVACERLTDGSGLDLLATLGKNDPEVLRIFAADAERLKKLGGHLAPFKLFDTIAYPLDPLQLKSALALAMAQIGDAASGEFENIVLEDDTPTLSSEPDLATLPTVLVLPRDPGSLESARAALEGRDCRMIAARDANEARADLVARQPVVALIDVGALSMDPVQWLTEAHRGSPRTVLVALGRRDDGQRLELLVTDGCLHRFVAKPVSLAGLRLVLDSALRLASMAQPPREAEPVRGFADSGPDLSDPIIREPLDEPRTPEWRTSPPPRPPKAEPPRPAPAPRVTTDYSIPAFEEPSRRGYYIGGAAIAVIGLAWTFFALRPDADAPASSAERVAVEKSVDGASVDALVARVETAMTRDDLVTARAALSELQLMAPDHPRVALLGTLVTRAEEARRMAEAPTAGLKVAKAAKTPSATVAAAPASNAPASAAESPIEAAPESPSVATAEPTNLRPTKLTPVSFAGRTLDQGGSAEIPSGPARVGPADARVQAPMPTNIEERPPPVVLEAKVLKRVAPDYPADAMRRKQEGSVEVGYTVTREGKVTDVHVDSATAPGVFDEEAMAAVRKWRFDPRREDGVPVDFRTSVRLEFRLD